MDLLERMGVERLMDGRLSSAGLMSGILTAARSVVSAEKSVVSRATREHFATRRGYHERIGGGSKAMRSRSWC